MGGGLMQLVAYGAQDIYLTGNPQITFFKVVYRRHTNFSMEAIEQTINGQATKGSRVTSTISRNGDLIYRIYHQFDFSDPTRLGQQLGNPGANCFETIELEIGGQKIDKITGKWMEVWAELTEPNSGGLCGTAQDTNGTLFQQMSGMGGLTGNASIYPLVPLPFWFCRNPGLALPLIALQYHEVKLITTMSNEVNYVIDDGSLRTWVDYIYLDTDERRRFAQVSHEYLIEQLQYFSDKKTTFDLNFNHPVKEIIWTASQNGSGIKGSFFSKDDNIYAVNFQLKLNGHDRFSKRSGDYFTRAQIWEHHTGPGGLDHSTNAGATGNLDDSIAVYSFALKPEEHQPSGTCNFSRIDNAQLIATSDAGPLTDSELTIYAINYNVLRIMSGMGGLAYSN
jgi:hypothetical protein